MKKKSDTLQQKVFLILDIKSNRKGILIMNALDVKKTDSAILSQDQKEIVFEKNISIKQDVLGNEKVEFRIAGNGHFTVGSISSISSVIYNAPVLLGDYQRYYLYDGYPVVDVLQNEVSNQEERDENMQKIEKAWSNFLKVLNEAGKLK